LRASPLFHFSLASKELFHSNFLAWLCETYPNLVGPLFARFTKAPSASCEGLKVHREKRNKDLMIEFPNGETLIVENKVKSIASAEQLRGYAVQERDKKRTSFLLLSLIRPPLMPSDGALVCVSEMPWHFLSYSDLACHLEPVAASIAAVNRYHSDLVGDYLGFVRNLVGITSHVALDWDNDEADFFSPYEHKLLRGIRLYDLMDKLRYGQLALRIKQILEAEGCRVVESEDFWDASAGVFRVGSALYRGEALCEFWYRIGGSQHRIALGVMFQGDKIKVSVHGDSRKTSQGNGEAARRAAAELLNPRAGGRVWFDLGRVPGDAPEMPVRDSFCQYSGIVFYRYKKVAHISPKRLVDLLVGYALSIRDAADVIRSQIGAAC
jgi:hypothetical protein